MPGNEDKRSTSGGENLPTKENQTSNRKGIKISNSSSNNNQ